MKRTAFVTSLGVGLVVVLAGCDAMVPISSRFEIRFEGNADISAAHAGQTINLVVLRIDPMDTVLVIDNVPVPPDTTVLTLDTVVVLGDDQVIVTNAVFPDLAFEFVYATTLNLIADHLLYYYIDTNGNGACDDPATDHHVREVDNSSRGDWLILAVEDDAGTTDICFGFNF